jgi:hypothetical protein
VWRESVSDAECERNFLPSYAVGMYLSHELVLTRGFYFVLCTLFF